MGCVQKKNKRFKFRSQLLVILIELFQNTYFDIFIFSEKYHSCDVTSETCKNSGFSTFLEFTYI
jgi:hypothetical protein